MQRFNDRVTVQVTTNSVQYLLWCAYPTVTVYDSGTAVLSTLYSDDLGTPLSNPFTGDSTGRVYFYAADGKYDIVYSGGTPTCGDSVGAELLDDTLSLVPGTTGILSLNGLTVDTQGFSVGLSGSDFNIVSYGSGHTFNLPFASGISSGKLSSADHVSFNSRLVSINGLTATSQTLGLGTSGSTPNLVSTGSSHTINLPVADASHTGVLSFTDWQTFNSKLSSLTGGGVTDYVRGDWSFQNLNSDVVTEGSTNLYFTQARARLSLSATSPVLYDNTTGIISADAATVAQNGYLTSTDWNTFNDKLGSLNALTTATQSFSTDGSTGTDFAIASAGSTHVFKLPSASSTNRGVVTTGPQTIQGPKTFASEVYVQKYIELTTISDLTNAASGQARWYLRLNGSGKHEAVIIFPTGVRQVFATEP